MQCVQYGFAYTSGDTPDFGDILFVMKGLKVHAASRGLLILCCLVYDN